MRMSVDERITTILVDTCAFRDANSDFIGISSMLLPSFFSVIKEKDILLLTHPILEREIEKHIEDSGIYKDYQSLVSHINKCKDVLRYANCCDEELFSKIADYNIKNQTFRAYKKYYRNLLGGLYRENPVKSRNYEAVKSSKKWENVGNSYIIPALLLYRYSYI